MENDFDNIEKQVRETIDRVKNDPTLKPLPKDNRIQENCRNSLAEIIKTKEDAEWFRFTLAYALRKKDAQK